MCVCSSFLGGGRPREANSFMATPFVFSFAQNPQLVWALGVPAPDRARELKEEGISLDSKLSFSSYR